MIRVATTIIRTNYKLFMHVRSCTRTIHILNTPWRNINKKSMDVLHQNEGNKELQFILESKGIGDATLFMNFIQRDFFT